MGYLPRFGRVRLAKSLIFCSLILILPASARSAEGTESEASGEKNGTQKILAGYFEEWSIYGANYNVANLQQNHVGDKISHLIYAFANVAVTTSGTPSGTPSASCQIADSWADYQDPYLPSVNGTPYAGPVYGNFAALQQLKQLHPNLKILISLGGASAANTVAFSTIAANPTLRSQFAASCIDMFISGNIAPGVSVPDLFDGIDVDWGFPGAGDKQNFTALLREFRKQLDKLGDENGRHYLLTIAAPAGAENYSNIELHRLGELLDFINVEAYDHHGSWESTTNFEAALFDSKQDPHRSSNSYIEYTIEAYLDAGVPAQKIILGVPFYGYGWTQVADEEHGLYQAAGSLAASPAGDSLVTAGVATFESIEHLPQMGYTRYFDVQTLEPWLYSAESGTFWTYDDAVSVAIKMLYVNRRVPGGLGGAFFWAFKDDDANGTLAKTMATELGRR
jgi:chitinase